MIYKVKEEKRLDTIVFEVYGSLRCLEDVLERNPHIKHKMFLQVGDVLELPPKQTKQNELKALW